MRLSVLVLFPGGHKTLGWIKKEREGERRRGEGCARRWDEGEDESRAVVT